VDGTYAADIQLGPSLCRGTRAGASSPVTACGRIAVMAAARSTADCEYIVASGVERKVSQELTPSGADNSSEETNYMSSAKARVGI